MRTKKFLSLLLSLVMILSMLPAPAAAFQASEGLYFRLLQQDSNGNYYVDAVPNSGLCGAYQNRPKYTGYVQMCYIDAAGNETALSLNDPNLTFPSFLDISTLQNDPTLLRVDFAREGSGVVSYTAPNSKTFELSWSCSLNRADCYSAPVANIPNLIPHEFDYKDNNDTFYIAAKDGFIITDIYRNTYTSGSHLEDIATITLDPSGKFATVRITADLQGKNWYGTALCAVESSTNSSEKYEEWISLSINDAHPSLKFRRAERDSNRVWYEEPDNYLHNEWYPAPGFSSVFTFYYVEDGVETKLNLSNLAFSGNLAGSFANENSDDGIIRVEALDFGTGTISYKHTNGKTYSVHPEVDLPTVGFYSTTTPSQSSYLRKFTVTSASDTVYLAALPGRTINSVTLRDEFQDFATCTIAPGGSYAEVKITGTFDDDRWYGAEIDVSDSYSSWTNGMDIKLFDGRPSLKFRQAERDSNRVWYEELNNNLETRWSPAPGYGSIFTFYYVENGVETKLKLSDLAFSPNLAGSFANENSDDGIVRVEALDFGTGTISYTHNGQTHSVHPEVDLPPVGFYSTTTPSQSSYLREFTVDSGNDTFYIAAHPGFTINSVTPRSDFRDIATGTLAPDGSYVEIKITGAAEDGRWYDMEVSISDSYTTWTNGINIRLFDARPSLKFRWVDKFNGNLEPYGDLRNQGWRPSKGYSGWMQFSYVENGVATPIALKDLTADGQVLTVSQLEDTNDPTLVRVRAVDFGTGTISYKHTDGKTYYFHPEVVLPPVGFYSTTTASQSDYLREFTVDANNDTFYLAPDSGITINSVTLTKDFQNIASCTVAPDGSYAEIKVTGTIEDGRWYGLDVNISDSRNTWTNGLDIKLFDARPSLKFRWVDKFNGNPEPYGNLRNQGWRPSKGYSGWMQFSYVENGVATPIALKDLTADGQVLTVSQLEDTNDPTLVRVRAVDFGTGSISYTHNGSTYKISFESVLPIAGLYSTPTASTATYLQDFTVTDTNKTLYLVARDSWKLDSVTLKGDLANIAKLDFDPAANSKYATITITGDFNDGRWYDIGYHAVDPVHNDSTGNSNVGLELRDGRPGLKFRWAEWDQNNHLWHEELRNGLRNKWDTAPGYSTNITVYYVENGVETRLKLSDLSFSLNLAGSFANKNSDDGIIRVDALDFGTGTISYEHSNGQVYTFHPQVALPEVGYYTTTTPSQSSYLTEFTVTDTDKTFYFAPLTGLTIESIILDPAFDEIADYVISQDKTYATITVTGIPEDMLYGIDATLKHGTDTWYNGNSVKLINDTTNLYCQELDNQNGVWVTNGGLYFQDRLYPGHETIFRLGFGAPSNLKNVSLKDLTVTGPIDVREDQDGNHIVKAYGWGQGIISYSHGGKTYSVYFNMELPGYGALYKQPVRNTGNFLGNKFTVTADNKTVYIMPGDGYLFDYANISPELEAIADVVISPDRTYAAVTITDDNFKSGEYIINEIGETIPGYTNWRWGNSEWPLYLTNAISAPAATTTATVQSGTGSGGQDTVQLAMTNNFAVDQWISFLVALYNGDQMIGLKTLNAFVQAGQAFVQDIDVQLANATSLKVMAIDSKFTPLISTLPIPLQATP